jgi:hypothetical protein
LDRLFLSAARRGARSIVVVVGKRGRQAGVVALGVLLHFHARAEETHTATIL